MRQVVVERRMIVDISLRRTSATIAIGAALRQHTLQQRHPRPDPPTWRMATTSSRRCMRCAQPHDGRNARRGAALDATDLSVR